MLTDNLVILWLYLAVSYLKLNCLMPINSLINSAAGTEPAMPCLFLSILSNLATVHSKNTLWWHYNSYPQISLRWQSKVITCLCMYDTVSKWHCCYLWLCVCMAHVPNPWSNVPEKKCHAFLCMLTSDIVQAQWKPLARLTTVKVLL